MVITIEKIPGSELNKYEEEERIKLATCCLRDKIAVPTARMIRGFVKTRYVGYMGGIPARIEHEENVDYTIIDMSQATQEEQEAFMKAREKE